ncbi:MAG: DUF1573 domain-containing protein [Flavobacterium sp.]|nr:DUF1573 domain-containing protein [Flavobacterium sp.]
MKMIALVAIFAATSCKNKNEFPEQQIDVATNKVMPPGLLSMQDDSMKKKLKPEDYPVIEFDAKEFDFGTIKQGDKVEHIFKFKNTGKNDLTVIEVRPSCGCTAPEWTRTPVKKGETGEIKIVFNSAGKFGKQTKTVSLLANTLEGNEVLTFKANIVDANGKTVELPSNTNIKNKH